MFWRPQLLMGIISVCTGNGKKLSVLRRWSDAQYYRWAGVSSEERHARKHDSLRIPQTLYVNSNHFLKRFNSLDGRARSLSAHHAIKAEKTQSLYSKVSRQWLNGPVLVCSDMVFFISLVLGTWLGLLNVHRTVRGHRARPLSAVTGRFGGLSRMAFNVRRTSSC